MDSRLSSKISIREDRPTGTASREHGANLDGIAFNLRFIAERRPLLAIEILRLRRDASTIQPDDPMAPTEDYRLAEDELNRS
jgi:hypothetical protein